MNKTPYELHEELKHEMTIYSPDGMNKIEECLTCGKRWLWHHASYKPYPITLDPKPVKELTHA